MPDDPGALHKAARIIKEYSGNINRIQFDRRIDPGTVFFEVTATAESYAAITRELAAIGYLQTSLKPLSFLKFCIYIPNHRPGTLLEFLNYTTSAGANIAFIDFDENGRHPDRLTVSLNLEQSGIVDTLLDQLKSQYRIEILEYDTTGKHLDDTVFYVRYAQAVREIIGGSEEAFILSFLADTNHIAQELMERGCDPRQVFESVLLTGRTMQDTTGDRFYADVQKIPVTDSVVIFCFQLPCGGNVFVIETPKERVMLDTGYGIYHDDVMEMLSRYALCDDREFSRIIVTHADADHCGASGYFDAPVLMHHGTQSIIETNNRAYGSRSEHSVLEAFYTKMINIFSKFETPGDIRCFPKGTGTTRGIFPIIDRVTIGRVGFEVLDDLGGHTFGQVFLFAPDHGLLFAADSVINFSSLSKERADYSSLAAFLVTSVNVDSERARAERKALLELATETDKLMKESGRRCLIFGGHGAVSVLEEGKLVPYGEIERYEPGKRNKKLWYLTGEKPEINIFQS